MNEAWLITAIVLIPIFITIYFVAKFSCYEKCIATLPNVKDKHQVKYIKEYIRRRVFVTVLEAYYAVGLTFFLIFLMAGLTRNVSGIEIVFYVLFIPTIFFLVLILKEKRSKELFITAKEYARKVMLASEQNRNWVRRYFGKKFARTSPGGKTVYVEYENREQMEDDMDVSLETFYKLRRDYFIPYIIFTSLSVLFIVSGLILLTLYRPFTKWESVLCMEANDTLVVLKKSSGVGDFKYIYTVDGVKYEKIYRNVSYPARNESGMFIDSFDIIYVNKNNPLDTKRGWLGGDIEILMLFIFGFGVVFVISTFVVRGTSDYKKIRVYKAKRKNIFQIIKNHFLK